jgi:CHAT domain-containing protein
MLGADASETNLKAAALDGYNYIHFATHGLVDDDNPDYSALLLDEVTSNSASEDGVLHAFEIAKLKLNTDLVVLSACNTGLGRLWSGDGMIGLNWAFLAAGARALCVTLWSIDDKSTSVFMRHFYQLLLKGESPAEALQRTRVFMLRETEYRSPYYWAPFVLIGAS